MSITSDRFCVYLRKDTNNDDLLKFINGQKSLSASIRLLIKAYMATAKTLDVESADLFDVINAMSAKNLSLLDPSVIVSERLADKNRAAKVVSTDDIDDATTDIHNFDDVYDEEVVSEKEELYAETKEPAATVVSSDSVKNNDNIEDSGGSINDFMGDF